MALKKRTTPAAQAAGQERAQGAASKVASSSKAAAGRGAASKAAAKASATKANGRGAAKADAAAASASSNPAVDKIVRALAGAEDMPADARKILAAGLPAWCRAGAGHCSFDKSVVEAVQRAVTGAEAKLEQRAEAAKEKVREAGAQAEKAEEARQQAQVALDGSSQAVAAAEAALAESREEFQSNSEAVTEAEAEIRRCDSEIGASAMEREQLRADAAGVELEPARVERIAALDQAISRAAIARVVRISAVEAAQTARDEASERQGVCDAAVKDAKAQNKKCIIALKEAVKVAKQESTATAKAQKALDVCLENLSDFRAGPLAAARELRAKEEEAARAEKRPADAEAEQVVQESLARAVRRRRCSWLPRHLLAAREARAAEAAVASQQEAAAGEVASEEAPAAPAAQSAPEPEAAPAAAAGGGAAFAPMTPEKAAASPAPAPTPQAEPSPLPTAVEEDARAAVVAAASEEPEAGKRKHEAVTESENEDEEEEGERQPVCPKVIDEAPGASPLSKELLSLPTPGRLA